MMYYWGVPPRALRESASGKLFKAHAIGSLGDHDLGVLTVAQRTGNRRRGPASALYPQDARPGLRRLWKVRPAGGPVDWLSAVHPLASVLYPTSQSSLRGSPPLVLPVGAAKRLFAD